MVTQDRVKRKTGKVPDAPLPSKLVEMLCCSDIPLKEEYHELLQLLQVPVVWDFILKALSEAKGLYNNEIDNYLRDREK